jgi:homopolymeric O-antigen transport system permease protein
MRSRCVRRDEAASSRRVRTHPFMSTSTLTTELPVERRHLEPPAEHLTIIEPSSRWRLVDFRELFRYRDLLYFLTFRSIRVLYAQSAIGIGWAVLQPLCSMIVFTVVFGMFAKISSDDRPYAVFSLTALVPWTYFQNALLEASNSLVNQAQMITKVYFPRVILPLSAVFAKLIDFSIASVMLAVMLCWYRIVPTWNIVYLPLLVVIMVTAAAGLGMWFTALAIHYRDVKHALNFISQLIMYASPVVYPVSYVPAKLQPLYAINPMVGVIEGFRAAILGTRPMPWDWIAIGSLSAAAMLLTGLFFFRHQERIFADVA